MMVPFSYCVFRLKTDETAGFVDANPWLCACQPRLNFGHVLARSRDWLPVQLMLPLMFFRLFHLFCKMRGKAHILQKSKITI